jgi:hypothetical protein
MADSAVLTFTDPDAYHANIRRTQVVEGVVTARGEYRSELTRTDLHRLWMQRGDESLARVLNFAPAGERVPILFATDQRQAAMHFSGAWSCRQTRSSSSGSVRQATIGHRRPVDGVPYP